MPNKQTEILVYSSLKSRVCYPAGQHKMIITMKKMTKQALTCCICFSNTVLT